MPSLRRTVSNPLVRASPYHSNTSGTPTRLRRACSGAEPSSGRRGRVVLADIEWWRVLDGQLPDTETEPDLDGSDDGIDAANGNYTQDAGRFELGFRADVDQGVFAPEPFVVNVGGSAFAGTDDAMSTFPAEWGMDAAAAAREPGALSITTPFAALSISSMLPTTPPRRTASSSVSSTESSPSNVTFVDALASMGSMDGAFGLGHGLDVNANLNVGQGVNVSSYDASAANSSRADLFSTALSLLPDGNGSDASRRPSTLGAAFMIRSASFNGFDTPRESFDDRFEDVCHA